MAAKILRSAVGVAGVRLHLGIRVGGPLVWWKVRAAILKGEHGAIVGAGRRGKGRVWIELSGAVFRCKLAVVVIVETANLKNIVNYSLAQTAILLVLNE